MHFSERYGDKAILAKTDYNHPNKVQPLYLTVMATMQSVLSLLVEL